jgi:hypothetical protein
MVKFKAEQRTETGVNKRSTTGIINNSQLIINKRHKPTVRYQ